VTPAQATAIQQKTARVRARLVRGLVDRWGLARIRWLIDAWARGVPDAEIGKVLGLSGQRVGQIRQVFGVRVCTFQVHAEIPALLAEKQTTLSR
jgi:hypothetical protein